MIEPPPLLAYQLLIVHLHSLLCKYNGKLSIYLFIFLQEYNETANN